MEQYKWFNSKGDRADIIPGTLVSWTYLIINHFSEPSTCCLPSSDFVTCGQAAEWKQTFRAFTKRTRLSFELEQVPDR